MQQRTVGHNSAMATHARASGCFYNPHFANNVPPPWNDAF